MQQDRYYPAQTSRARRLLVELLSQTLAADAANVLPGTKPAAPPQILVIEADDIVAPIQAVIPAAVIIAVGAADPWPDDEIPAAVRRLTHDYLAAPLPFERGRFDYIVAPRLLELAANPQDMAAGLGTYLTPVGSLLTSALNIRGWRIQRELRQGNFYHSDRRLFARPQLETLLLASFYKDTVFIPCPDPAPAAELAALTAAGWQDVPRDPETIVWLVAAARCHRDIAPLKKVGAPKEREQLATLLRRLDYAIEPETTRAALARLVEKMALAPEYLAAFIGQTSLVPTELAEKLPAGKFWQKTAEIINATQDPFAGLDDFDDLIAAARPENTVLNNADETDETDTDGENPAQSEPPNRDNQAAPTAKATTPEPTELTEQTEPPTRPAPQSPPAGKSEPPATADNTAATFCFITCVNDPARYAECVRYIDALDVPPGYAVEKLPITAAPSMAGGYEQARRQSSARYKIYLHQDVLLVNRRLLFDLLDIWRDNAVGLIGVIGCRRLPSGGIWWYGRRLYGRVLHACEPESLVDTEQMQPDGAYQSVEAVDGLFIAARYDVPWRDDLFTGWHFYDSSICREYRRRGLRVVVARQPKPWCVHQPTEKPLDAAYYRYQRIFLAEYGAELKPEV